MVAEAEALFSEPLMNQELRCERCAHELLPDAAYCARCGEAVAGRSHAADAHDEEWEEASDRSRAVALLLCVFLGYLGVHRFYVGKIGTGLLWLCTGGMFGVGYVIDGILIATGHFRDHNGRPLIFWDASIPLVAS